jgi:hypothetical protein
MELHSDLGKDKKYIKLRKLQNIPEGSTCQEKESRKMGHVKESDL